MNDLFFSVTIETTFLKAQVQLCIVHQVRHGLNFVSWKQRKEIAFDLKEIYNASTVDQAEANLEAFGKKWDASLPKVSQPWRHNCHHTLPIRRP